MTLCVHYLEDYPNVLPKLSLKHEDENIDDSDIENLLADLRTVVGAITPLPTSMSNDNHDREKKI